MRTRPGRCRVRSEEAQMDSLQGKAFGSAEARAIGQDGPDAGVSEPLAFPTYPDNPNCQEDRGSSQVSLQLLISIRPDVPRTVLLILSSLRPNLNSEFVGEVVTERGHQLAITANEPLTQVVAVYGDASRLAASPDTSNSLLAPAEHLTIRTDTHDADAELVTRFRSNTSFGCSRTYQCQCHGSYRIFRNPPWMRSFLGSWSGGYRQSPSAQISIPPRCGCQTARRGSWWLDYEAPLLFWMKTLQIRAQYDNAIGLQTTMRFPRFVSFYSDIWDIVDIPIRCVKDRLHAGAVYLPDDRAQDEVELLEVTAIYHEMPPQNTTLKLMINHSTSFNKT